MIRNIYQYLTSHIIVRYLISGSSAAVVNLVIFTICLYLTKAHPVFISVVASCAAFGVSFLLQKYFTFRHHHPISLRQLLSFFGVFLCNLCLTTFLFWLFLHVIRFEIVDQFLAAGFTAAMSFFIYRFIVFSHTSATAPETGASK